MYRVRLLSELGQPWNFPRIGRGWYIGRDRGKASILAQSTGRLDPGVSEGEEQVTVLTHSVLLAVCLS